MPQPLEGIRVLALEQFGAGPWATLHLADLGAEIIKIEDPTAGGDVARYITPYAGDRDSIYFQSLNRNKKSVTLDLRTSGGRGVFEALVRRSDVVFNNLRGDVPGKLGVDYQALGPLNPRIVCCSLSSFGRFNSRASEPGYDYIMQAYAGWMSLTGEPDGKPTKSGLSLVDLMAGVAAGLGLVAGLVAARETGIGRDVDVSLFDTAYSALCYVGAWHLSRGYVPRRMTDSSHPSQIPSQIFATMDGYIAIMCVKEKFWRQLCVQLEREDLLTDERFGDAASRLQHHDALTVTLGVTFTGRPTGHWLEHLRGHVPCGPVNDVESALRDPLVEENDLIIEIAHPELGVVRQLATAIKASSGGPRTHKRGPRLGEHTEEVLTELLGLGEEALQRLRDDAAI